MAAYKLEQLGHVVEKLILIAPGAPKINHANKTIDETVEASYKNITFLIILYSVFTGKISGVDVDLMLAEVCDEESFVAFTVKRCDLDKEQIKRIVAIVYSTYNFKYTLNQLMTMDIKAPIIVLNAKGDEASFIDNYKNISASSFRVHHVESGHYEMLKENGINELLSRIS